MAKLTADENLFLAINLQPNNIDIAFFPFPKKAKRKLGIDRKFENYILCTVGAGVRALNVRPMSVRTRYRRKLYFQDL